MSGIDHLDRPGGRIAFRSRAGRGPCLIFLPGYMSDMEGGKAIALDSWAEAQGRAMVRFDYRGCGASDGDFESCSLADWRDDALTVIDNLTEGRVVLIGSSMGGWLMLLAALARPERIAGLVGIAAAPDFTSWGFTDTQKRTIAADGRIEEPNPHGEEPTVTTRAFWESGEELKLLDAPIPIDCPVRLLHGLADADVPWRISLRLMEQLHSADVQMTLVKDGEHRMSREGDLALLLATVNRMLDAL